MEEDVTIESKFSSGLNIVRRLDQLWRICQKHKRDRLYSKWNEELDTIWLELARDLFEKEKIIQESDEFESMEVIFNKFDKELSKQLPFMDGSSGFNEPDETSLKKRNEQYKILMKKQLFLARLENYIGKGTTEKEREDDWD